MICNEAVNSFFYLATRFSLLFFFSFFCFYFLRRERESRFRGLYRLSNTIRHINIRFIVGEDFVERVSLLVPRTRVTFRELERETEERERERARDRTNRFSSLGSRPGSSPELLLPNGVKINGVDRSLLSESTERSSSSSMGTIRSWRRRTSRRPDDNTDRKRKKT